MKRRNSWEAKTIGLSGRYGSVMTKDRCADCNVRIKLKSVGAHVGAHVHTFTHTQATTHAIGSRKIVNKRATSRIVALAGVKQHRKGLFSSKTGPE